MVFRRLTRAEAAHKLRERDQRRRAKLLERRRSVRNLPRPGQRLRLPRWWEALCRIIRARDGDRCRFCGREAGYATLAAVDHIILRRLCTNELNHDPANLALLCCVCHATHKAPVERALMAGDPHPFLHYLKAIWKTGPVPSPEAVEAALGRLTRLLAPDIGRLNED